MEEYGGSIKGGKPISNLLGNVSDLYGIFSQGKKAVRVEGCFIVTPDYEWLHSWWGGIT